MKSDKTNRNVNKVLAMTGTILGLAVVSMFSVTSADAKATTKKLGNGQITTRNGTYAIAKKEKTVTLKKSGTYTISGNIGTYRVVTTAKNLKVTVVLKNVIASHKSTACIYSSSETTELTVQSAKGSVNQFSGPSAFQFADGKKEPNAVIFSEGNLKLCGSGKIVVKDTSSNGDAIGCDETLTMIAGTVQSNSGASALQAKDIVLSGGTLYATSGDTAVKASGTVNINSIIADITAVDKGIQGKTGVIIKSGTLRIKTSHSTNPKFEDFRGISAGVAGTNGKKAVAGSIAITGGTITIHSYGDCIHAANNVTITGGNFNLTSDDDDGVQAKAVLTITGTAKLSIQAKGKKAKGGTKNIAANIKF